MPDSPAMGYRGHVGIREWMGNLRAVAGAGFRAPALHTEWRRPALRAGVERARACERGANRMDDFRGVRDAWPQDRPGTSLPQQGRGRGSRRAAGVTHSPVTGQPTRERGRHREAEPGHGRGRPAQPSSCARRPAASSRSRSDAESEGLARCANRSPTPTHPFPARAGHCCILGSCVGSAYMAGSRDRRLRGAVRSARVRCCRSGTARTRRRARTATPWHRRARCRPRPPTREQTCWGWPPIGQLPLLSRTPRPPHGVVVPGTPGNASRY